MNALLAEMDSGGLRVSSREDSDSIGVLAPTLDLIEFIAEICAIVVGICVTAFVIRWWHHARAKGKAQEFVNWDEESEASPINEILILNEEKTPLVSSISDVAADPPSGRWVGSFGWRHGNPQKYLEPSTPTSVELDLQFTKQKENTYKVAGKGKCFIGSFTILNGHATSKAVASAGARGAMCFEVEFSPHAAKMTSIRDAIWAYPFPIMWSGHFYFPRDRIGTPLGLEEWGRADKCWQLCGEWVYDVTEDVREVMSKSGAYYYYGHKGRRYYMPPPPGGMKNEIEIWPARTEDPTPFIADGAARKLKRYLEKKERELEASSSASSSSSSSSSFSSSPSSSSSSSSPFSTGKKSARYFVHKVEPSDSLQSIADKYHVDKEEVRAMNNLPEFNMIHHKRELRVPYIARLAEGRVDGTGEGKEAEGTEYRYA